MKTLSFLLFFCFPIAAFSQTSIDEKAIQDLIQNSFDDLFSDFESDKLLDYYTADFLLLEQGEVWNNELILDYFEQAKNNPNPVNRTNRFDFIETKVNGNTAWIAYHNFATISRNGEVIQEIYWLESATAVKTENGWRLDMLHSTRAQKPKH